jgi:CheY-like chemotaxis protein
VANSKILVIDDSRVIRKTVKDMLPEGDFEVIEAKDGVEGINLVNEHHPSLIMLDFILPKMSGWEVFQQIQSHPDLQKIPLVLMSGRREEVTNKISEPFEYFEFVEKPFDKVSLAQAIKDAMAKAKKVRPQAISTTADTGLDYDPTSDISELQERMLEMEALQERMLEMENATTQTAQEWMNQLTQFRRASSAEIEDLQEQVAELTGEVATLKKQLAQLVMLIKKKFV